MISRSLTHYIAKESHDNNATGTAHEMSLKVATLLSCNGRTTTGKCTLSPLITAAANVVIFGLA